MNKMGKVGAWGLVVLATVGFCLSILTAQPSDAAISDAYRDLIARGVVDDVVTAEEIGLGYLSRETVELAADAELIDAIYRAEREVSTMPEDIPLEIPNGTHSPIDLGRLPADNGTPRTLEQTTTTGFIKDGTPQTITPGGLAGMFNGEAGNGGNLAAEYGSDGSLISQTVKLYDSKGKFLQAARIPVIDLIVRNRNGRRQIVRRVNANAFCRDALNAVFNRTLRRAR